MPEDKKEMKSKSKDEIEITLPKNPWIYTTIFFIILTLASVYTKGFSTITGRAAADDLTGAATQEQEIEMQGGGETAGITVIWLVDSECKECYDVAPVNRPILQRFEIEIDSEKTVEVRSNEGKELVEKYSITKIPCFIISKEAFQNENLMNVWFQVGTVEGDGSLVFRNPDNLQVIYEELQDDGSWKVMGGIEKSDRPKMELFVMSMCPYGVQAEDGVKPVVDLMKDYADFEVYFISTDNEDGTFRSLHGQPETDENIRQVCIVEHAPDKFWDYLECLNPDYRNAGTKWSECTEEVGIDTETIRTCFEGDEGAELLKESIKRTMEVGATGSPTILINGGIYKGSRSPEDFKRGICMAFNEPPEECEEILSSEGAVAAGNC